MQPYALLHRDGADHVEVLTGDLRTVATLADIPLSRDQDTLALIPFRQITERGFDCADDEAPLECLVITGRTTKPVSAYPPGDVTVTGGGFDISDDAYAEIVDTVLRDEIGHGEGSNFVIHRVYEATMTGEPEAAFGRLLHGEQGAYWTFLVHTGTRTLVGASPERHVSVTDGLTMMNPISGTFRHGSGEILDFLRDPKEVEELLMVLDEELKMMAVVAEEGGQVVGPYLKQMAHLTHTEYLLAGRGSLDVREVLRETMFAPTVTGSPIENACRVIARHERRGRGYYGGVLALLGHDEAGRQTLDAPILIRTAEISPAGALRVPVGATLVRHSTPAGEVAETHTKAAGILAALGVRPPASSSGTPPATDTADVRRELAARNTDLARFWLDERAPAATTLAGRSAVIVDAEDTFTAMLAHQLRSLGLDVSVTPYLSMGLIEADLVIAGPGPGDPGNPHDPKMSYLRGLLTGLLAAGRPVLGVCLGHQILSGLLGLPLERRDAPYQGVAEDIDLFGTRRLVGFYSSFTARSTEDRLHTPYGPVEIARDPADGSVHALRGTGFAGVQFHPESVLSRDGVAVLTDLLPPLFASVVSSARTG
ncbi:anthranilate synthase family protein [Actinoplanes sp. NBRC 103695]|uniref:anthranilate synthase family protein n=1 Tax=Actinoplanes sp. NBRC 103695 TaxID=3032202 RepID=UPI0024A2666F|nr:anthranilate synthase family protein [Actinoplanes sp. NBRC 103695]GLY93741.1 phenazine-specific anthranilate synthase component I [Actinoplanes sp. NBRC 103695]